MEVKNKKMKISNQMFYSCGESYETKSKKSKSKKTPMSLEELDKHNLQKTHQLLA